jgi:hypothetical protein
LDENQVSTLLGEGLELVASREKYSLRELIGTLIALKKPELRAQENRLARERSVSCSAFVQQLFQRIGLDLIPGVNSKHSTPEDVFRTPVPHTKYLLLREMPGEKIQAIGRKLKTRVRSRLDKIKRR